MCSRESKRPLGSKVVPFHTDAELLDIAIQRPPAIPNVSPSSLFG